MDFHDLKPYKSLLLARSVDDGHISVDGVLDDFADLIGGADAELTMVSRMDGAPSEVRIGDDASVITTGFVHYYERRAPGWYGGTDDLADLLNHLFVVTQLDEFVAIYASDASRRTAVARWIREGRGTSLTRLQLIDEGILNAAFVSGPAKTVWLTGIHGRVKAKPDAKVLSGADLRDALDPLGDQTYYFTAARSHVEDIAATVGVAPRGSRVWVGATRVWQEFVATVGLLLHTLRGTTRPTDSPLPVVAIPVLDPPKLRDIFEFQVMPPELLADDPSIPPEERELMERWAYHATFRVVKATASDVVLDVQLDGRELGRATLAVDVARPRRVGIHVLSLEPTPDCTMEEATELRMVCRRARWVKMWFESGHTLADGALFKIRHRDIPFDEDNWIWHSFTGYDIDREKFWSGKFPKNALQRIGTEGSLFCWVLNNWANPGDHYTASAGWLACDDGAMEIADFIHLDDRSKPPWLTLIHVKGAKTTSPDRRLSVAAYEVVTGQAIKNLRYLDRMNLAAGLDKGLKRNVGNLVWHARKPANRKEMIERIAGLKEPYKRLVVVLQPHVAQTRLNEARDDPGHRDREIMRQLDTLLLSAAASCHDLGAEFRVVADVS